MAYAFCDGYTLKTVEAELMAGTTYYIFFADGGQNIRKLEYKYLSDPESVVLNNYTLRFKTDKNWFCVNLGGKQLLQSLTIFLIINTLYNIIKL